VNDWGIYLRRQSCKALKSLKHRSMPIAPRSARAMAGRGAVRMSRECKEMIATCFDKVGGLEGLYAWATSTDERRAFRGARPD